MKLPPGAFYELQITFTDALGRNSTMQIGKVVVPYGVRWSGLRYRGRWRQVQQAGAWLGSTSRAGAGAAVSATLAAGRPVFLMRATPAAARVEVRTGSHRQVFAIAAGWRERAAPDHGAAALEGRQVSLLALKGTVDLDGVAVDDERRRRRPAVVGR